MTLEGHAIASPEDVLAFWFGPPGSDPKARSSFWFKKDDAFDAECRARFESAIEAARRGELAWSTTPRGRLARVILLDQFSRNVFRGTAKAFAQDDLARDAALEAIAQGDEGELSLYERYFLYMPLMHAENADLQRKCVAAFQRLVARAGPDAKSMFESALDYAQKHADIIERFGRFPHRNAILGRTSTKEEEDFLSKPGSSF